MAHPFGEPPRMLPPEPVVVDRESSKRDCLTAVDTARNREKQARIVLTGPPGIGLTTLVVFLGHALAGRCPDGHFYASLGGSVPGGRVDPEEILASFLFQIGRPDVPVGKRQDAFRSWSYTNQHILVVLDDVADVQQVLALLPNSPYAIVLITSRRRLDPPYGYPMTGISVEGLATSDAKLLLLPAIGGERRLAEPEAVAALLELCDGVPLALDLVARQLRSRPFQPLTHLVHLFVAASKELEPLYVPYSATFASLDSAAAAAYLRFALHLGPTFRRRLAAAMLGVSPVDAGEILARLVEAGLMQQFDADGYRFEGLARHYAVIRLQTEISDAERDAVVRAAVRELVEWAVSRARAYSDRRCVGEVFKTIPAVYSEDENAIQKAKAGADLRAELRNLVAAVPAALAVQSYEDCVLLCQALSRYLYDTGHLADLVAVVQAATEAARLLGQPAFSQRMEQEQGAAAELEGRLTVAGGHYQRATELAVELGDERAEASALEGGGIVAGRLGEYDRALKLYADAEAALRTSPDDVRRSLALLGMHCGRILLAAGRPATALERLSGAARFFDGRAEALNIARIRHQRGIALRKLGRLDEARAVLDDCVADLDPGQFGGYLLGVLEFLADVQAELGQSDAALRTWETAHDLAAERLLVSDQLRLAQTLAARSQAAGDQTKADYWRGIIADVRRAAGRSADGSA